MTSKAGWCFALLSWAGLCFAPAASQAATLRFATIDYCPFTCDPAKEDGREGFMTDVVREAFEGAGYTVDIVMLPYERAVQAVRVGTYDGIAVVGRDYAPELVYPTGPTVTQRVAFLVKADTSWRYTGEESLAEATVGIVKGFHYVDADLIAYLQAHRHNEARVHVLFGENTTRRGLGMLQANRITTLLEGEYSATYELEKMGLSDKVTVAGYTRKAFEDYTGFSPWNPQATEYAQILSDTIAELRQSGRLAAILLHYGITLAQTP